MSYIVERPSPEELIGEITIIHASYGGPTASSRRDVTSQVRSRVISGGLSIFATNDTFGCDPAPGMVKTLEVTYQQDSVERVAMAPEMWEIRIGSLSETKDEDEAKMDIIQAVLSDPEEFDTDEYEPASVETMTSSGGIAR